MYTIPASVFTISCFILLSSVHLIVFVDRVHVPARPNYYLGDVAISCGSTGNSVAVDGREWIGDAGSTHLSLLHPKAKSRSSVAVHKAHSADLVPYMTARISAHEFSYAFEVNPGQKFIRLHFYPTLYRGFEKSQDFFTVKAGPFTLLGNFSASLAAEASGVKYLVKEFCLNVEENGRLNIAFFPSQNSKSDGNRYAFINGIEIISTPAGLYFTPHGGVGARVVGRNYAVHVDDRTALEMVQRLNTGGSSISPVEDFGLFRRWEADTNYLYKSLVHPSNNHAYLNIPTSMSPYIAPLKLYQTSWKAGREISRLESYNFTWKIMVDPGFAYLIRLHFCQFDSQRPESGQVEFDILINNQIADTKADVTRWSGGNGIPAFRDYMEMMKGNKEGSKFDLVISLQSKNESVVSLLYGLEIFKLSDLENSLASPNPVSAKRVSISSALNIRHLLLALGRSHGNVTSMIILITFINAIVYGMKQLWEKDFQREKDTGSASTESSYRYFSLAEIRSATHNFSEAFVIGKGGFGKVYKGIVSGIPETLAIKRLNSNSKQGAHEFWSEIGTLSKLRHIHLVSLLGHCNEGQEMILVYKYMPRGTLADNLYKIGKRNKDHVPLSWEQRLTICIGAARGLDYLHTGTEPGVIHRDVKDSNILLDENLEAKISDFGLSKLERISQSKSYVSTKVKGTWGYIDPDCFLTHKLTRKSDVYAFGVVLLVVLSGRPVVDTKMPGESQSLLSCFRNCTAKGEIEEIVDPVLRGKITSESLKIYVKSIEKCLQHQPKKRPTMAQVVVGLEDAMEQQSAMFSRSEGGNIIGQFYDAGPSQPFQFNQGSLLPVHKELVPPLPKEDTMSKPVLNTALPNEGKNTKSRGISLRGWPWETLWSRDKPMNKKELIPANRPCYRFSITDIKAATENFSDDLIILRDRYKVVYRGQSERLPMIYRFKIELDNEEIREFCNEIDMLSQLRHSCLVVLIGYAYHKNEIFIIYDYSQIFTLNNYLYESKKTLLSWKLRLQICISVARGLDYLHQGTKQRIIHRDMRPESIFLDENLNPKITNFGLSKVGPNAQFASTTMISSCAEYLSPEVLDPGLPLTEKSDVYSLGLMLLEVLCCHKRIDYLSKVGASGRYLHHLVKKSIVTKTLHCMIDPQLDGEIAIASLTEFLRAAFSCMLFQATERPSAGIVADRLEAALKLQEMAEAEKQDIKGKVECNGLNLDDIYKISDFIYDTCGGFNADGIFKIPESVSADYTYQRDEYTGMSQEILESVDLCL